VQSEYELQRNKIDAMEYPMMAKRKASPLNRQKRNDAATLCTPEWTAGNYLRGMPDLLFHAAFEATT